MVAFNLDNDGVVTTSVSKSPRAWVSKPKMTAEEATSFSHYSEKNAAIVELACEEKGCGCGAYNGTVLTYGRWKALSRHVNRGEKALAKILTISLNSYEDDNGQVKSSKFPRWTAVFCIHQTSEINGKVKL